MIEGTPGVWEVRLIKKSSGVAHSGEVKVSESLPLLEQEAEALKKVERKWGSTCEIGRVYPQAHGDRGLFAQLHAEGKSIQARREAGETAAEEPGLQRHNPNGTATPEYLNALRTVNFIRATGIVYTIISDREDYNIDLMIRHAEEIVKERGGTLKINRPKVGVHIYLSIDWEERSD